MQSESPRAVLGSRDLFPDLEARSYLNFAAVSPPSQVVRSAVVECLTTYARLGLGAVMPAVEQRYSLKESLAILLGCEASDLGLTGSTSRGLMDLANCIPLRQGDRILCFNGEFPTNVTPWKTTAQAIGAQVDLLDQEGLDDGDVLALVEADLKKGGVRLIAVSAVQFSTGRCMPLRGIVSLAHEHGAEVVVDAIQAVGVMPLDVMNLEIDYLAGGAHKWLMGIEGAGFVYAHRSRLPSLRPRTSGWLSHEEPVGFLFEGPGKLDYDRPIRKGIDFVEAHSMSAVSCAALGASVGLLLELGVPAIQAHIRQFNDALEEGLLARRFTSLRPAGSPSATLSVLPPAGQSSVAWTQHLNQNGIAMSGPDGKLRFAPHWCNHLDEVPQILEVVDAYVEVTRGPR